MIRALALKELRESIGLVVVAALGAAYLLATLVGFPLLPWQQGRVYSLPFVQDELSTFLWLVGGGLAIALGLKQTAWESQWGTYYFLFHRPIERATIFWLKLAVGAAVVLLLPGAMVLCYALWAATPNSHDAPFRWSMTLPAWLELASLQVVYLGAFASGLRSARWFGTKLAPLVAACVAAPAALAIPMPWLAVPALALAAALLLVVVFTTLRDRDF